MGQDTLRDKARALFAPVSMCAGLLYHEEPVDLVEAALMAGPGPRIEIGCLTGFSTCCIAAGSALEDTIISVDLFDKKGIAGFEAWVVQCIGPSILNSDSFFELWQENVVAYGGGHCFHPIRGDHIEVLPQVLRHLGPDKAPFLFLDGPHDSASVRAELDAYLPLCTPDAIVAFHDYTPNEFGVKPVVDAAVAAGELRFIHQGYLAVTRRVTR